MIGKSISAWNDVTMECDGSSRAVPKGAVIFEQGDQGDCAYIIERGEVEIALRQGPDRIVLGRRRQGDIFGEMAIMDHTRRSASAVAVEDCELLLISREQLAKRIERTDPVLRLCLNVILRRFRDTMSQWTKADPAGAVDDALPVDAAGEVDEQQGALHEIKLEQELRRALTQNEFEMHYQPILHLEDEGIAGFEALIRWDHPERGLIAPALFMPTAEANGLIVEIGHWVMKEACLALARFNDVVADERALFMSINVSSRDIEDEGFVERLDAILDQAQVDPGQLKLEITESLLMDQPDIAIDVLGACKDRGLSIAIDDFGTGYSSLSYLHRFPIDTIKIDRSFVQGIDEGHAARQIIAAIIGLARQLDLPIVAEGIEETEQAAWLRERGCQFGQGFLYARPLAETKASSFLKKNAVSMERRTSRRGSPRPAA